MPTYEYRCKSCAHQMEVQQAFTDDPLETCPECQGPLRKVYGNVGISFKGSGFYKNDARGGSSSKSSSSTSTSGDSAAKDSGSSDSGSSDSGSSTTSTEKAATSTSSD
jgi:putative FmdB family regulatory protein